MTLHEVNRGICKNKRGRRLGRGPGSGSGKTAARGGKGQTARHGYNALPIFQGGSLPLVRRVPKRGFTNSFAMETATVNVGDLEAKFEPGDEVNLQSLKDHAVLKTRCSQLKVLGDGVLTKKLKVVANRFSASARDKITQAGGEVVEITPPVSVEAKKKEKKEKKKQAKAQAGAK